MYKLGGRGGGRGGAGGTKRPPAPHGRGRGASSSAPPPRGRAAAAASASLAAQAEGREEAFSLESSGPPAFAAVIKLTPDLIDEIRRAEEAGGGARIMFNSNINPAENIIDVDGKQFNFTWSSDPALCDIYEERQSGEGGNGSLIERGSAWRKVNVQRILDESAKNTVKKSSEEAERISKSRKSIVLDPMNPSVKIQAKSMTAAAVEGNMRRMKWNQKEHFKKNQAAVIPTKSISKVKLSNNSTPKASISTSPALSPEQPGSSIPPFAAGSDAKHEVIVPFDLKKEESSKVEKAKPNRISQGINRRASSGSASVDDNANDLRGLLISILSENPKGMNLKALEKAVADAVPNASKKIESIIKNVANYQAPGRYVLKPELEVEISKHDASGSGRTIDENIEEAAPTLQIDDPDIFEKIEIGGSPVSAAGDEKVNDSDGKAGTSSESGSDSDSDSDSSGSGSDSGSQSRSAASGSGSSSDSDSDASSSSKEGSDAIVDITSDDNKADTSGRKVADELKLSSSPRDLPTLDGDDEQIDIGTNLDYTSTSSHIDLNNFNIDNDEAAYTAAATEIIGASKVNMPSEILGSKNMGSARSDPSIVDGKYPANKMSYKDNLFDDPLAASSVNLPTEEAIQFTKQDDSRRKSTSRDGTNHVPTRTSEKGAKSTLKRGSDNDNATTKPESAKKAKADNAYSGATGSSSEHRQNLPPDKYVNERLSKETGNVGWDTHTDLQLQDSIPSMKGRLPASGNVQKINQSPKDSIQTMHSEGTKEKIGKASSKKKVDKMQKPSNSMDCNLGKGYVHVDDHYINFNDSDDSAARKRGRQGGSFVDGKMRKRSKDATIEANSINIAKGARGNVNHNVVISLPECIETNGQPSILQRNSVDKSPPAKKVLQREQSELELGELREGSLENDIERTRRQFERNSSSKSLDGKATNVDNSHPSMNNTKVAVSAFHDQRKPLPHEFSTGSNINQEGIARKTPGYDFDNSRSQQRVNVSQGRQLPRTDNLDSENLLYPDRLEKIGIRETEISQGGVLDHVDLKKKKTTSKLPQNGTKNGIEPRTRKSISPAENEQRSRNNSLIETEIGGKRRDSSSDEDNLFFSKYDKEEPELKGRIKDFSQYQDYVQEYNEKYQAYSYLNSQLKKTQSEFLTIQEDFDAAKERDKDQYYNIVERLRDMYHESGMRHKLMKKVFLLLHEELLTIKRRILDFAEAYSNE